MQVGARIARLSDTGTSDAQMDLRGLNGPRPEWYLHWIFRGIKHCRGCSLTATRLSSHSWAFTIIPLYFIGIRTKSIHYQLLLEDHENFSGDSRFYYWKFFLLYIFRWLNNPDFLASDIEDCSHPTP